MFRFPEILVFAGPNGSGKSSVTQHVQIIEPYINADEIKKEKQCTDLEAAQIAEKLRNDCIDKFQGFTFETVLSTDRNLKLLQRAKERGFFIRCFYVLTVNKAINVGRVATRVLDGGHNVPVDKICSRYDKALALIPDLLKVCDILHIYDNSGTQSQISRIFKKRKDQYFFWENDFWKKEAIERLTNIQFD